MRTKNKVQIGLAVAAGILIIFDLVQINYQSLELGDLGLPLAMILVIISMIISIKESQKGER